MDAQELAFSGTHVLRVNLTGLRVEDERGCETLYNTRILEGLELDPAGAVVVSWRLGMMMMKAGCDTVLYDTVCRRVASIIATSYPPT